VRRRPSVPHASSAAVRVINVIIRHRLTVSNTLVLVLVADAERKQTALRTPSREPNPSKRTAH